MAPKYDLDSVKLIVQSWRDGLNVGWFSAPSCSIDYIIYAFGTDNESAMKIVLDGLLALKPRLFSHRVVQWGDVADVYGLPNYLGHNWYVKFMIDDDGGLEQISFHPCEKDLRLENGEQLDCTIDESSMPPWRR